jgi:hypothetical protein
MASAAANEKSIRKAAFAEQLKKCSGSPGVLIVSSA